MKKDFHFRTIGIVGWKDKSPDLALALDVISAWATARFRATGTPPRTLPR